MSVKFSWGLVYQVALEPFHPLRVVPTDLAFSWEDTNSDAQYEEKMHQQSFVGGLFDCESKLVAALFVLATDSS